MLSRKLPPLQVDNCQDSRILQVSHASLEVLCLTEIMSSEQDLITDLIGVYKQLSQEDTQDGPKPKAILLSLIQFLFIRFLGIGAANLPQ